MPSRCRSRIKARSNSAKTPKTDSSRVASGESSPVKVSCSLTNSMQHAVAGQLLHDAPQIVEVARQPVHAMHHHGCVALAHKGERPVQFRTPQAYQQSKS